MSLNEAFFPKTPDGRYQAKISVVGAQGSPVDFSILPDTGADLILLSNGDAKKLGHNLDAIRDSLQVEGIHTGIPGTFKIVPSWVQIGQLSPIQAPVGLATSPEILEESLLGDKGILDNGLSVTYDNSGVRYRKSASGAYSRSVSF